MLDRIERVARVKGVESAIDRSFERKEGYNESKKNKQSFEKALTKEMDKEVRPANEAGLGVPNAYRLASEVICLPLHHGLSEEDVERIIQCVTKR